MNLPSELGDAAVPLAVESRFLIGPDSVMGTVPSAGPRLEMCREVMLSAVEKVCVIESGPSTGGKPGCSPPGTNSGTAEDSLMAKIAVRTGRADNALTLSNRGHRPRTRSTSSYYPYLGVLWMRRILWKQRKRVLMPILKISREG